MFSDTKSRPLALFTMDVETAIRTRRTHKAYSSEPVSRETLAELLDLARWAPNHNLTKPLAFPRPRVSGAGAPEIGGWA